MSTDIAAQLAERLAKAACDHRWVDVGQKPAPTDKAWLETEPVGALFRLPRWWPRRRRQAFREAIDHAYLQADIARLEYQLGITDQPPPSSVAVIGETGPEYVIPIPDHDFPDPGRAEWR